MPFLDRAFHMPSGHVIAVQYVPEGATYGPKGTEVAREPLALFFEGENYPDWDRFLGVRMVAETFGAEHRVGIGFDIRGGEFRLDVGTTNAIREWLLVRFAEEERTQGKWATVVRILRTAGVPHAQTWEDPEHNGHDYLAAGFTLPNGRYSLSVHANDGHLVAVSFWPGDSWEDSRPARDFHLLNADGLAAWARLAAAFGEVAPATVNGVTVGAFLHSGDPITVVQIDTEPAADGSEDLPAMRVYVNDGRVFETA